MERPDKEQELRALLERLFPGFRSLENVMSQTTSIHLHLHELYGKSFLLRFLYALVLVMLPMVVAIYLPIVDSLNRLAGN